MCACIMCSFDRRVERRPNAITAHALDPARTRASGRDSERCDPVDIKSFGVVVRTPTTSGRSAAAGVGPLPKGCPDSPSIVTRSAAQTGPIAQLSWSTTPTALTCIDRWAVLHLAIVKIHGRKTCRKIELEHSIWSTGSGHIAPYCWRYVLADVPT